MTPTEYAHQSCETWKTRYAALRSDNEALTAKLANMTAENAKVYTEVERLNGEKLELRERRSVSLDSDVDAITAERDRVAAILRSVRDYVAAAQSAAGILGIENIYDSMSGVLALIDQAGDQPEPKCKTCNDTQVIWIERDGLSDQPDVKRPCPDCAVTKGEPNAAE